MRPEKIAITEEIRGQLDRSAFVFLAGYRGLTVGQMSDLRGKLRETGARFQVVKSSLFLKAASDLGWDDLSGLLDGPMAMVTGSGEPVQAARVLRAFVKTHERPALTGGRLGGRRIGAAAVAELADLPPREVLLAMVVGSVAAPMTRLVGVLQQKVSSLVFVLKAIERKKGEAR